MQNPTIKTKSTLLAAAYAVTLLTSVHSTFAQGSLTPPGGAPAPVMKSLAQVEPRTPISSVPYTISAPGSYYLTTNVSSVSNAITIAASGVTLDLSGFTIDSTAANSVIGGAAIFISGVISDISIYNGHIRGGVTNNGSGSFSGPGFAYGIVGGSCVNVLVSHVSVSACFHEGIYFGAANSVVEFCTVRTVGGTGITASIVKSCWANDCGSKGISGEQVSDSSGRQVGNPGYGIQAVTALNCYGSSNSGIGISSSTALNCYGSSSSGSALVATTANNCTGTRAGGTAIQATVANGCYALAGTNIIANKYNMP